MGQAQDEALVAHRNSQLLMKERFTSTWPTLNVGDKVLLDATHLRLQHGNRKLSPKRYGPFIIDKVMSKLAYRLKLPVIWKNVHPVFHISKLTPYRETTEYGPNFTQPIPD